MASPQRSLEMGISFVYHCSLRGFIWKQEDEVETPRVACQLSGRRIKGHAFLNLKVAYIGPKSSFDHEVTKEYTGTLGGPLSSQNLELWPCVNPSHMGILTGVALGRTG